MRALLAILALLAASPASAMEWWSFGHAPELDTATNYTLPMGGDYWWDTTRARWECTVPIDDVILEICVVLSVAPGAGDQRIITVMNGSTETNVSVTIADTATAGCDNGEAVFAGQTDEMSIQIRATGTPDISDARYAIRHRTDGNQSWLCGNTNPSAIDMGFTSYWSFAGTHDTTDPGAYQGEIVSAGAGSWETFCVHMVTEPGTGQDPTYTVMDDNSASDLSIVLSGTGSGDGITDDCDTDVVPTTAGESLSLKIIPDNATNATFGTWSISFNSTTKNRYMIPLGVLDNANPIATDYATVWGGVQDYSATESEHRQITQAKTRLLTWYTEINALGACASWTVTFRQNGSNTGFSRSHSAAGVLGDNDDISIADNDLLTYSVVGGICGAGGGPTVHNTFLAEGVRRRVD